MELGAFPRIFKISAVDSNYFPDSNVEIQLYSGTRVFLFITSDSILHVKTLYQPDFSVINHQGSPLCKAEILTKRPE